MPERETKQIFYIRSTLLFIKIKTSSQSKPPQPPPLLPHMLIPRLVTIIEIHPIRLALQALARHLAVDANVLDQRLQRDVVVFGADVPQDQQVQARGVEVGEFVEGDFLPGG